MTKIYTILASVLLAFLTAAPAPAQELPFTDGETLQYTVHYKYGFSADLASVTTTGSVVGNDYHVTLDLRTFRLWDSFFKIRDRYETTFRMSKGVYPRTASRNVSEGGYWAKCDFTWGADPKSVRCVLDKKDKPHRDTVLTDGHEIRDVVNVIYYCRAADFAKLEAGEAVHTTLAMDRTLYHVQLRFAGRERKKVGSTWWNTIKVGISLKAGGADVNESNTVVSVGDGGEKVFFWVSDDDNRVPVFFSAGLKVGAVQGRLASWSGLKYPETSKE